MGELFSSLWFVFVSASAFHIQHLHQPGDRSSGVSWRGASGGQAAGGRGRCRAYRHRGEAGGREGGGRKIELLCCSLAH